MEGYGINVHYDGVSVQVQPAKFLARATFGANGLAVPASDIASLLFKGAGRVANGRPELRTHEGKRHQLHFTREQQPGFEVLHTELQAVTPSGITAPSTPSPVTAQSSATPTPVWGRGSRSPSTSQGPLVLRSSGHSYFPQEVVGESHYGVHLNKVAGREPEGEREVFADIARPGELLPIASPDASVPHLVIPTRRWYRVKTEDSSVLAGLLAKAYVPGKAFAYASLHLVERVGPRSTTQIVVVRIGDLEAGELSKQTSAKLVPLLAPLRGARVACYAEASLTGNAIAAEVRVQLTMPEDLPQEFVGRVQAITS
ncbi:hypothetical protein ABTY98_34970 [Streptomyces sp. NPDC096040]|uniref:hypothetical protein n=1 Tax=Streptomyces sp. NPDC096040 TaxID=3155541 RepID=UPI003324360D